MVTKSRLGGTRIPYENISELPPLKYNDLVAIHLDGSVRYFVNEHHEKILKDKDVIAVVYNGISGVRLPQVIVTDAMKFDSLHLKCIFSLRYAIRRYVVVSMITVSIYRVSDETFTPVGYFKTPWAAELSLRARL